MFNWNEAQFQKKFRPADLLALYFFWPLNQQNNIGKWMEMGWTTFNEALAVSSWEWSWMQPCDWVGFAYCYPVYV